MAALLCATATPVPAAEPPFSGTIFINKNIIAATDGSLLKDVVYLGQGVRTMFDRRLDAFAQFNAYLFTATFQDSPPSEVQVNPEFNSQALAQEAAQKYATIIGRLPAVLRKNVQTVWIHKGKNPFGGGNNNLLIHTDQADAYELQGILEETLVHEASHTSLDLDHSSAAAWLAAQAADATFISTYARDNPTREDVAESFLPYLAIRYRRDRIPEALAAAIIGAIPARIAYFDAEVTSVYPNITVSLGTGWNLIGNGRSASVDVATAFGDGSSVATVWKWIAATSKWAFYAPSLAGQALADYAAGKGYEVLTTVNGGEGVWVNAKAPFVARLRAGAAIKSASFQSMPSGWNLIATGDGLTPRAFNNALGATQAAGGEILTNVTTIWTWDAAQANWYFYAPGLDRSGALSAYVTSKGYLDFGSRTLDSVTGFWVNRP